jgi:uncharacterized protein YtpQ (UPF0354 family)
MTPAHLATFEHPAGVYRLQYPAAWEHLVQEEGRSCGFGPRDRDDVGLWISILPVRVDTDELQASLGELFAQALAEGEYARIRPDRSLRHFGLKADSTTPGSAGHYWLVAGGDVVLFASTQVPAGERGVWTEPFDRVMASLAIRRDDELSALRVTQALVRRLREHLPGHDWEWDGRVIRGRDRVVSPASLIQQVRAAPDRQAELVDRFIGGLLVSGDDAPGAEHLEDVREAILPVLKPADYVRPDGPTAHLVYRAWLGDVIVCYSIHGARTLRFISRSDLARWGLDDRGLHDVAMANLQRLPLPARPAPPAELPAGVVMLSSGDSLDAVRLLDPRLHDRLAPLLGSPFYAGVPERDSLVLFPTGDSEALERFRAALRDHFERAPYPISPQVFLVTRDGIAPVPDT